jgi:hypothetical protein
MSIAQKHSRPDRARVASKKQQRARSISLTEFKTLPAAELLKHLQKHGKR